MAKTKKLKENGSTIYPATIPQAVVDPNNKTKLSEIIDDLALTFGDPGESKNIVQAMSDLRSTIGEHSESGLDGYAQYLNLFIDKVNAFLEDADASDATINRWKEIESFLAGITDTDTLTGLLADILTQAKAYTDSTEIALSGDIDVLSGKVSDNQDYISALETDMYDEDGKVGKLSKQATTTTNGLMSATDKVKLDGIAAGANKYTLPVATASALGGVKSGEDVEVDSSGIITVHFAEKASEADCDENGDKIVDTYARFDELPVVATASKAGLVKSGGNITVTSDGTVTVNKAAAADMAGHATEADRASYATSAGSATSATKATQDKNGADIAATYLKSAAVTDVTEYAEITI